LSGRGLPDDARLRNFAFVGFFSGEDTD